MSGLVDIPDYAAGALTRLRHHSATAKQYCPSSSAVVRHCAKLYGAVRFRCPRWPEYRQILAASWTGEMIHANWCNPEHVFFSSRAINSVPTWT